MDARARRERRVGIAREIAELAAGTGDRAARRGAAAARQRAAGEGSPAFRAAVAEYRDVTDGLRQPRHDYLRLTRRAALALLDGDIDEADG